jgi:hypothetical protein
LKPSTSLAIREIAYHVVVIVGAVVGVGLIAWGLGAVFG